MKSLEYFPVVGIIGPRQSGKTTLVKQVIEKSSRHFVYLDCERPRDLAKLTDPVLFFENDMDKCVVLDEIQLRPDLFSVLRSLPRFRNSSSPVKYF